MILRESFDLCVVVNGHPVALRYHPDLKKLPETEELWRDEIAVAIGRIEGRGTLHRARYDEAREESVRTGGPIKVPIVVIEAIHAKDVAVAVKR